MAHTAKKITSHGMVAGIWFMPFAGNFRSPYFDKDIFAKNADGTPFHDGRWSGTCIDASNPKGEEKITYDMKKLGLDESKTYIAYDYWENKPAGKIKGTLEETLPAGTCRILALKPQADHPQLISTSRHITQGLIDVLEENWAEKSLSGKSKVVGNDPYELRIALPAKGSWKAVKATADEADIKLGAPEKGLIRATIATPENKTISWKIIFENN